VPTELKAHAIFEQAASIETSNFAPPAGTILLEKILAPYVMVETVSMLSRASIPDTHPCRRYGREPNQERYEEAVKKLESALDVYDAILAKNAYLAGDVRDLSGTPFTPSLIHSW
jgi:glutathione S-transferase